jgi:lipoyl(octanoyl) transferase
MFQAHFLKSDYDYLKSIQEMEDTYQRVLAGAEDQILAFEYKEVLTLGRRLKSSRFKTKFNGNIVETERGGEATFHNPGQLVVYPIINLRKRSIGPKDFVCLLEKSCISVFKELGIEVHRKEGRPGLYTSKGKIMSIGLRIKNAVSTHGISVNISNSMEVFSGIPSCGVESQAMDKVCHYCETSTNEFYKLWQKHFEKLINSIS